MDLLLKDVRDVEWFQSKLSIQSIPYQLDSSVLYAKTQMLLSFQHRDLGWDGLTDLLTSFIHERKRLDWVLHIIKDVFLYKDELEIERIFSITDELMTGEREDLLPFIKKKFPKIPEEIITFLWSYEGALSLDSFFSFRGRPFLDSVTQYVEVAIDEYKMEQEYQNYLDWIRRYVADKSSVEETVHVHLTGSPVLYDAKGNYFKESDLQKHIDRRLMSHHPIYVDSQLIAPLLSLSPKRIYFYTDSPNQPIIRTCLAIFEEKLEVLAMESFPFRLDISKANF
ncbi:putative sporulation protein YtxC [Mangrovibacillus cuniculi]|uniref:Sporulation protein YtxC n=1 Tax=Mangrovibacillus cuniculi TaxID=2593652 RepID=A0A7S8CC83_9BACI|nr:putative sporulation protein YtxC [Mangrovibacillus cuniculi]QPC47186.1 hypothetical protein G8O30_09495 [Mangrovibacillus cuniculi]